MSNPPQDSPSSLRVRLRPGREKVALENGHPWIFSGAVAAVEGDQEAPVARVRSHDGRDVGLGFYNPRSQIRVRLLGRGVEDVDRGFFACRLREALALRREVLPPETTGYRLLNAEGDGVPGWTVDRFGDVLVSQITAAGLEALRAEAYAALAEVTQEGLEDRGNGENGAALTTVLQANDLPVRKTEGLGTEDEVLREPANGRPDEAPFLESGLRFTADLRGGQKTGFYCDQRDNRRRLEALVGGRDVLDLFAHAGAFGVYARRGGARRVLHVESSSRLVERGRRAYRDNDLAPAEWLEANVFDALRGSVSDTFGAVVCDPPPLVRKRADLDRGARAYKDLNRLALKRVAPGGYFFTFSCSGAVDSKLFRQILFSASREARLLVQLIAPLAASADHPVAVTHPEGEYLKGWLCRVVRGDS